MLPFHTVPILREFDSIALICLLSHSPVDADTSTDIIHEVAKKAIVRGNIARNGPDNRTPDHAKCHVTPDNGGNFRTFPPYGEQGFPEGMIIGRPR